MTGSKPAPDLSGLQAQAMLEDAPCAVVSTDADGVIIYANQTLMRWVDRSDLLESGAVRLPQILTTPGQIYYETQLAPMLELQGQVREIACYLRQPNADARPVLLNAATRRNAQGRTERIDFFLFDARERRSYEQALREAQRDAETLAAIVRASPSAVIRTAPDGIVRSWNDGAHRLTGYPGDKAIGQSIEQLISFTGEANWFAEKARDVQPGEELAFEAQMKTSKVVDVTLARIGGSDDPGGTNDLAVIIRDVTARKQAERNLSLMVDEMNHRVKNTLTVVDAIARQTLNPDDSESFSQRLRALAQAHDVLTQGYWAPVDLTEIVQIACDEAGGPDRLMAAGPRVMFTPRQATSFAMLLHELVTNALKYGSLSSPDGRVELRYALCGPDSAQRFSLTWQEFGGPPVTAPKRTGFGSTMIETLFAYEFNARSDIDFAPDGLICKLDFAYSQPAA